MTDKKNPWGNSKGNNKGGNKSGGGRPPSGGHGGGRRPSGGNGPEPIDFDRMINKAKSDFGGMMPGNFGGNLGGGALGLGALLLLGFLFVTMCAYIVKPGEHAVVQRFGAWERTKVEPGLSFKFPWPIEQMTKVDVEQIRKMNIGFVERFGRTGNVAQDIPEESLMLTSDRNIVDVDLVIQWNIKSAEDYLFNIQDQESTVKKVVESAIREQVGKTNMFPIITTDRNEVAQVTRQIIQQNLDEYNSGVGISQVLIQRAEVHPDVQEAFQDVQSAKQDAEDKQNRARAYREDILPKARGEAIQLVQGAQAYKQSVVAQANGDAERFNSVYESYQSGKDVTRKRMYLETMEDVLGNAQKIILDDKGGTVPYLPLNELTKRTAK
jgi:membrane protease subunit HflK